MRRILKMLFRIIPKNIYENCIRQNLFFMPRFLAMAKYGSTEVNAEARMELWVENGEMLSHPMLSHPRVRQHFCTVI